MDAKLGTVLITGGTGCFGTYLAKECLKNAVTTLRLFARHEYDNVTARREFSDTRVRFFIGDVRDRDRLWRAMQNVNTVFHCAALKHVDICEFDPIEAIKTNIIGAVNVIDAAIDCKVEKVINISTDKAVRPINLYGATKLCAEKLFAHANVYGRTQFSSVRFGNLWGSKGSAIELWQKQRAEGKPITITERDMSRYWIHIDEATRFTLSCFQRMTGGEVFIPVMPSYTLEEMVSQIAPECKQVIIGRRAGEKKKEELFNEDEAIHIERQKDCLIIR